MSPELADGLIIGGVVVALLLYFACVARIERRLITPTRDAHVI